MNCICGNGLNGKQRFCSDKCRKQASRTNSDKTNVAELNISDELGQLGHEVGQALTIDDIIKMPLEQAKAMLRSWATGAGTVKQYLLGNLAIEYDVTKHNYPVSHIVPRPKSRQA